MTPDLWNKYLKYTKAWDNLYFPDGKRCPSNPAGARCRCREPKEEICKGWHAIVKLVAEMNEPAITEDLERIQ